MYKKILSNKQKIDRQKLFQFYFYLNSKLVMCQIIIMSDIIIIAYYGDWHNMLQLIRTLSSNSGKEAYLYISNAGLKSYSHVNVM